MVLRDLGLLRVRLSGSSILVTGSTDGLGREVARELTAEGASVLVHGRDADKVDRVAREVGAAGAYVADLSSLGDVRRLAEEVERDQERLDVLVSNAGIIPPRERQESEDGYELGFAVNYLSHFLLTRLLRTPARIVNVASAAQQRLDFDDIMLERGYDAMRSYSQSKLAQVMFTFELAERGHTANALHPASLMDTKMVRESFGSPMTSVDEGAEATLRVIELEDVSGRYFDGQRESRAHRQAYDPEARRRLWELSEELTAARV